MFQKATYAKDDAAGVLGGDCGAMFDTSYSEFSKNPDFMRDPGPPGCKGVCFLTAWYKVLKDAVLFMCSWPIIDC